MRKYALPKLFLLTAAITLVMFYLFEENRSCLFDFGTRCSNQFLIRSLVQTIVMTAVFYFSMKRNQSKGES